MVDHLEACNLGSMTVQLDMKLDNEWSVCQYFP